MPNDSDDSDLGIDQSLAAKIVARLDRQWASERLADDHEIGTLVGQQLGSYSVHEVIGRGAFGVVYLATDNRRNRAVALKVPRHEVLVDGERYRRFIREAELAARLDHAGIVPVVEASFESSTPFIAYAYCPGPDLGKWLRKRGEPVTAPEAAQFVAQVAQAVDFAHSQGVVHRDLKPGNILLEPTASDTIVETLSDYRPQLTDFGLAKLLEGGLQETRSSMLVGTPTYLAPEQLLGESSELSPAADVYALGVILFELVTLRTPFEGASYVEVLDKLRNQQPPRLQGLNPGVPGAFEVICRKCLEKDPADRYPNAQALSEDLQRFLKGKRLQAGSLRWWEDVKRWTRKPERLSQCGLVSYWAQIFALVWVWAYFALAWRLGAIEGIVWSTATESALLSVVFSLPLITLGWLVGQGRVWAFWPALAILTLQFIGELLGLMSDALILTKLYTNVQSKLASYAMLLLGSALQLILYGLAIPAWFRQLKKRRSWSHRRVD